MAGSAVHEYRRVRLLNIVYVCCGHASVVRPAAPRRSSDEEKAEGGLPTAPRGPQGVPPPLSFSRKFISIDSRCPRMLICVFSPLSLPPRSFGMFVRTQGQEPPWSAVAHAPSAGRGRDGYYGDGQCG